METMVVEVIRLAVLIASPVAKIGTKATMGAYSWLWFSFFKSFSVHRIAAVARIAAKYRIPSFTAPGSRLPTMVPAVTAIKLGNGADAASATPKGE